VSGAIEGDAGLTITGVSSLDRAQPGHISFFGNQKYKQALAHTKASAIFVGEGTPLRDGVTFVRVKNPSLAFAQVAQLFHPPKRYGAGIEPGANVHPSAQVDPTATIMAGATVREGATIGARAVLFPGVFIGDHAHVGPDSRLSANVAVLERCVVGARCVLHPSVVIGADGFGFAFDAARSEHVKIPQTGSVRIEDDVEIGACSCVDRATTGETVIGRGTKIDNLVQVGHNCTVGPLSILCAQVGLSGTTELGTGVMLGGQTGTAGHQRIGDLVQIGAQSGVLGDVENGAVLQGTPAIGLRAYWRSSAVFARLPDLQREVRELKRRLEALEGGMKP
jgi:UDP-3-O-[3-hydroxymyristoyl] glucosamine N-acyltransferase